MLETVPTRYSCDPRVVTRKHSDGDGGEEPKPDPSWDHGTYVTPRGKVDLAAVGFYT